MQFADDLAVVTTSWYLLKQVVKTVEEWCINNNMLTNSRKSGVMFLDWKRTSAAGLEEKELFGYPVVREYKYLGGWINDKLKVASHLAHMERKVLFVTHKLTPIRLIKDLRLNINLFRTMCMPLYRMGLLNCLLTTRTDHNAYYQAVRKRFKAFCYLPRSVPNKVVDMLLGSVRDLTGDLANRTLKHMEKDFEDVEAVHIPASTGYYKEIPASLYKVFDLMYRSACTEHNRLLNRSEMARHDLQLNLRAILRDYQWKRRKNEVNQKLKQVADELERVGRRFTSRATLARPLPDDDGQNAGAGAQQPVDAAMHQADADE